MTIDIILFFPTTLIHSFHKRDMTISIGSFTAPLQGQLSQPNVGWTYYVYTGIALFCAMGAITASDERTALHEYMSSQ